MDILLVSNGDMCRSRMAQELLYSFGKGMKISTAGIAEGNMVPSVVSSVMAQKGYEVSRKKPVAVATYANRHWDMVVTLCKEAADEIKYITLDTEHLLHLEYDDPLSDVSLSEDEQEQQIAALYEDMYRSLYEFYRDTLSEYLAPRCTCGANDYCRCQ